MARPPAASKRPPPTPRLGRAGALASGQAGDDELRPAARRGRLRSADRDARGTGRTAWGLDAEPACAAVGIARAREAGTTADADDPPVDVRPASAWTIAARAAE